MVESLDSALARIDPIDLAWLTAASSPLHAGAARVACRCREPATYRAPRLDQAAADNPQNITATRAATTSTAAPA